MAILQAARAYILGLPEESAKSWGLNRAIFYAAAKRGFKGKAPLTAEFRAAVAKPEEEALDLYRLGDEMAFKEERSGRLYFTIGGQMQTEEEFHRQVESRFEGAFEEAWREALEIVRGFDRKTLLSQRDFYSRVYKPRRDELAARWARLVVKRVAS